MKCSLCKNWTPSSVGGGKNGSNMTTASISASGDNAGTLAFWELAVVIINITFVPCHRQPFDSCLFQKNSEASLILTTLGGTSESMNNLTTTGENPGKGEEKALEEKKKRKKTNKVEEEDKSDKPAKSAKSSEAWTSSSFSSSASPEEDLLRLFSGQMSSTTSQRWKGMWTRATISTVNSTEEFGARLLFHQLKLPFPVIKKLPRIIQRQLYSP